MKSKAKKSKSRKTGTFQEVITLLSSKTILVSKWYLALSLPLPFILNRLQQSSAVDLFELRCKPCSHGPVEFLCSQNACNCVGKRKISYADRSSWKDFSTCMYLINLKLSNVTISSAKIPQFCLESRIFIVCAQVRNPKKLLFQRN